ncbi:MAG TPA: hypothetical protein PKA37_01755 [Planctomycetota bacterium]|nr:hypothetical protein [Planctomycetota bacterium]
MLILVNIIPIGLGAYLFIQHSRGEVTFSELPAGFTGNLIAAGGSLLLLLLVASTSLPVAHDAVKSLSRRMGQSLAVVKGDVPGSRILSVCALPPLFLSRLVMAVLRTVLIVLALALIAAVFLFLARLRWPDLLEEPLARALETLRSLVR